MLKKHLTNVLSKQDAVSLLEIIHETTNCRTENDFRRIMERLPALIPHEHAVCAAGTITPSGIPLSYTLINISYPDEWLECQLLNRGPQSDPIVMAYMRKFQIQHFNDIHRENKLRTGYWSLIRDFGMGEGYIHGVRNYERSQGSLFSFAGRRVLRNGRTEAIVNILVPHLHQTLARLIHGEHESRRPIAILSPKEREVLKWMANGKSSWEISVLLGISRRTVKFHIENVMRKLDASTRAHAAAIAVEQGLVDIE